MAIFNIITFNITEFRSSNVEFDETIRGKIIKHVQCNIKVALKTMQSYVNVVICL